VSEERPRRLPRILYGGVEGTAKRAFPVPRVFRPVQDTTPGRYPLLKVFRGLEETIPFRKYPGDDEAILRIAERTWANVNDGPGWMYVAPRRTPPEVRSAGFRMVESEEDEIVVARPHLAKSPTMDVYLDVIHEFLHILQRRQGRELWPGPKFPYADRPTEVEAYSFSIAEARRLGVTDSYLREYLRVFWMTKREYHRLMRNVGVPVEDGLARPRR
jgi:hypothetical protein